MTGNIKTQYCDICGKSSSHERGTFKCKKINGELFALNASFTEQLKKVSDDFTEFVASEQESKMNAGIPSEYARSEGGGLNLQTLFADSVRALKCLECGHLVRLSRLP